LSVFVDTSVWFAAAVKRDHDNARAKSILESTSDHVTSDHVLIETWFLLNSRYRRDAAEDFWSRILRSGVHVEMITRADLERAAAIGVAFPDQGFSIVDRTSFAVMERLRIFKAASFDADFSIYRFGPTRKKAFDLVLQGYSEAFRLLCQAILQRKQVTFSYRGLFREACPHILGVRRGDERALVYQFGGASHGALPQWRCFNLSDISNIKLRDGRWHTGSYHRSTQRCVGDVYLDVNVEVPNQPGRR
jgi:predicted nucleic acid-binding protein